MNKLFMVFFLIVSSPFLLSLKPVDSQTKEPVAVYLKMALNGYDIYSNDGELLLEFTKQNSDKNSLDTLEFIFQAAEEKEQNLCPQHQRLFVNINRCLSCF